MLINLIFQITMIVLALFISLLLPGIGQVSVNVLGRFLEEFEAVADFYYYDEKAEFRYL